MRIIKLLLLSWFSFSLAGPLNVQGQSLSTHSSLGGKDDFVSLQLRHNQHAATATAAGFDPRLAPFYHGVASGDPTAHSVILWTRVTPEAQQDSSILVSWRVASDTGMTQVMAQGDFTTDTSRDYTVKVEVTGLQPDKYYYYEFSALGQNSLRGRTKTAPQGVDDHIRLAVMSCSNYEAGFFHAYGRVAERADLDAVVHLGDYIYEYEAGRYGDSTTGRQVNGGETIGLEDYRARYSLYRLDPDLRRAHQQHPFITIWDDHESANDSYVDGAQNHQSDEGSWSLRKSVAKKAYFEWLPIRDQADTTIFRRLSYGDLVDLIMLDTRLEGRDVQILDVTDPGLYDQSRSILGRPQRDWFMQQLYQSQATWKLIGNQVVFSPFNIGFASKFNPNYNHQELEGIFMDIWDGYPAERKRIIRHVDSANIQNIVFLTGDFHCSFAFEVADSVNNPDNYQPISDYDPITGAGAVAVEFATPSVSSANFDENLSPALSDVLEQVINQGLFPLVPRVPNPHMKYVDLDRHGYVVLDVKPDTARANWYYVNGLDSLGGSESFGTSRFVLRNEVLLREDGIESMAKVQSAALAPGAIRPFQASTQVEDYSPLLLLSVYPNPTYRQLHLHFGLNQAGKVRIELIDLSGRTLTPSFWQEMTPGVYDLDLSVQDLPSGNYLLKVEMDDYQVTRRIVIADH